MPIGDVIHRFRKEKKLTLSELQDKGSGIQSAVIIGLYNYYTNSIAHTSSSLLAVEEPERVFTPSSKKSYFS